MVNHVHYFAYGSNMNPKRMEERKVYYFKREKATLRGFSLQFNKRSTAMIGYSAANIIEDQNGLVEGFMYTTIPEMVGKLDVYENAPDQYARELVDVTLDDGSTITCVTYIATPRWIDDSLRPSKEYLGHVLATRNELSAEYVDLILEVAEGKP